MRTLVLGFHGIGPPPAGVPQAEIPYWMPQDAFSNFVRGAKEIAAKLRIELLATFDDGNLSDLEIAAPLLKENGISGAFFPCTGRLFDPRYLSPNSLRQIANMGFEIGSHGIDHVPWTTLDEPKLRLETAGSKKQLEDVVGAEVKSVAIPFGAYNRRVLTAIKAARYSTIYTSDRGLARPDGTTRMRWTFRADEMFDIPNIIATASSPSHILKTAFKSYIKAHR